MIEYNELEPIRNDKQFIYSDLTNRNDALEATLKATNDLTSNQSFMYTVLVGINSAVPNQLKLTKIDYQGGNEIQIEGMSSNDGNILTFIEKLSEIEVIDKASLATMSVKTVSNQSVKTFVVKLTLIQQQTIDAREVADGS
jgi:type IV pilus assembly protein PilN